ncbi:MAG: hypothetical protein ACQXXG_02990 [Candidatus Bathyarchaeia archaeon]|jgi:hypothetical protein
MEMTRQLIFMGLTTLGVGVISVWCFMRGETINGAIGAFLFFASAGAFLNTIYKLLRKRR